MIGVRYANSKPKPSGPGRPDRNVYKQALRPVAEQLGKSVDAAWRRYNNVAEVYNKHARELIHRQRFGPLSLE